MILIFYSNGNYFTEARTLTEASEITHVLVGNIGQILSSSGNMTSNGYFFFRYDDEAVKVREKEEYKDAHIDKLEKALKILVVATTRTGLQERIDRILAII